MDRERLTILVKEAIEKDAVMMEGALGFLRGRTAKREGQSLSGTALTNSTVAAGTSAITSAALYKAVQTFLKTHGDSPLDPRTAVLLGAVLAGGAGLAALIGTTIGHSINTGPTVPPQYRNGYEGLMNGYGGNP